MSWIAITLPSRTTPPATAYFWRVYDWREFWVSKWISLDNKNSLKHYENSLNQLTLTVHGLIPGRAYYEKIWWWWW